MRGIRRRRQESTIETEAVVKKLVDRDIAYYTIYWSRLTKADKYTIINSVPSVAGIFEMYYMDEKKKLNLKRVSRVWYGGLRSRLRRLTDPELEEEPKRREILEKYDCYYRYSVIYSMDDMQDILFFFASRYTPGEEKVPHSGRYAEIYLREESPDKIVTID
jgi:hypothetical protein